jgi:ribosomal protein S27E
MATLNTNSFPFSEIVDCPKCHHQITVYDPEGSEYIACPACNNYFRYTESGQLNLVKSLKAPLLPPLFPIGSIGTLRDQEFKVIAYLEKEELAATYAWREYILYNHASGYATLAEYDGHWNLVKGKNFFPDLADVSTTFNQTINYNNIDFTLFNQYRPVVTAMVGEADWSVVQENLKATELIAPPFMLVREEINPTTITYYLGEYFTDTEIAAAFSIDKAIMPSQIGIGANQPSRFSEKWNSLFTFTGIAIVAVLLLHLLIGFIKPERDVINQEFVLSRVQANDTTGVEFNSSGSYELKPFVTPSFNIDDQSSNIEFVINSNVSNNWLEATIVLVNEKDNKTWEVTKGVEHYNGYEDGEAWSEGSTTAEIMLSNIPAGKYHLNVYSATGDARRDTLSIKATANSSLWRNTLLTALLLCIFPLYCWIRMRNYEKKRWNNSDHSPFVD